MNGIIGAIIGLWLFYRYTQRESYREWLERVTSDREYATEVEEWLRDNPAPEDWKGTQMEWAYLEKFEI